MDPEVVETPVETPTPADTTETEAVDAPNETIESTEEPPQAEEKSSGFERKVKKLTDKAREAEQRAEYWYNEATKQRAGAPAAPPEKTPEEPKFSDYNDIDAYGKAIGKYTAELAVKAALAEREAQQGTRSVLDTYTTRLNEFKAVTPDFDDVFDGVDMQLPNDLMQGILEAESGPAIAYHLAKHPGEVDKLLKLSPHRRLVELGKLEAKLQPKGETTTAKKVSSAPPVIKTPNSSVTTTKHEDQMSMQEWIAERNKNDKTLRRR